MIGHQRKGRNKRRGEEEEKEEGGGKRRVSTETDTPRRLLGGVLEMMGDASGRGGQERGTDTKGRKDDAFSLL